MSLVRFRLWAFFLLLKIERETSHKVRGTLVLRRPEWNGDLEHLRHGCVLITQKKDIRQDILFCYSRARDGTRTRGLDLGKVALHQLSHSRIYINGKIPVKRVMGIEPTYPAWKAGVLPLNYTRKRLSEHRLDYSITNFLQVQVFFYGGYISL